MGRVGCELDRYKNLSVNSLIAMHLGEYIVKILIPKYTILCVIVIMLERYTFKTLKDWSFCKL